MSSKQNLKILEEASNKTDWLRNHNLEPVVRHHLRPAGAETHLIRGLSCLTALVKQSEIEKETWECRFDECRHFRVTSLEDAIRHELYMHFDHRRFVRTLWSVHVAVIQPLIGIMPLLYLSLRLTQLYSPGRFHSPIDPANHQQHCP